MLKEIPWHTCISMHSCLSFKAITMNESEQSGFSMRFFNFSLYKQNYRTQMNFQGKKNVSKKSGSLIKVRNSL